MDKKYIFLDLDGTIIDHKVNGIRPKTFEVLEKLKENGHELFIATGRPPSLLYGIDEKLGIDSHVTANGCLVQYKGETIYDKPIEKEKVKALVDFATKQNIDICFETKLHWTAHTLNTDLPYKFSEAFHLNKPELWPDYHIDNDVYQMVLCYQGEDYKKFEDQFPGLWFNYANDYGIDVNNEGALKDLGVRAFVDYLGIDVKDVIAVGDGLNDITMIQYAGLGIAMGNAREELKSHADIVADDISNDGLYKVFKDLKLI